jgi:multiple antibiotic resistance protein
MGWTMLNHQDDSRNEELNAAAGASSKSHIWDQIFYPYTFPVTVGPGCIAVTLTLSAHSQHDAMSLTIAHQIGVALGIAANCLVVYFSLVYSDLIALRLGPSGTKVLLRLMAFVLICLGAEIFWTGAEFLLKQAFRS